METEWIKIKLIEKKAKTNVYDVISKCGVCVLGQIKWHGPWRHYCFHPTTDFETVHSDRCMIDIGNFIMKLNEEHKSQKNH